MITKEDFRKYISAEIEEFFEKWDSQTNPDMFPDKLDSLEEWIEHFLSFIEMRK